MSEDFYTIAERSGKDFKMFLGFDDDGQIEWTYGFPRALKLKTKEAADALLEGLPAFEGTSGKVYRVTIEEMTKAETEPEETEKEETEKEEEAAQPEESDRDRLRERVERMEEYIKTSRGVDTDKVWILISRNKGVMKGRLMTVRNCKWETERELGEIYKDDEIYRYLDKERGFMPTPLPVLLKDMLEERK